MSTIHLLEFARTLPQLRAFFYFSTDEVFGTAPEDSAGFVEDAPHNPTNPYSASKSASEMVKHDTFAHPEPMHPEPS